MKESIKLFRQKILEREKQSQNPTASNKLHSEIHKIFNELRDCGQLGELEPLLFDENVNVVTYAAQYFLLENENMAVNALERLKSRKGFDPFIVDFTIKQWKSGEMKFD